MFKNALIGLSVIAFAGGVAAILISLPERAWQGAMLRLSARLQLESRASLPDTREAERESARAGVAHTSHPAELARADGSSKIDAPPAHTLLDRAIDAVIEILRRIIGSRGFPRSALRVLGLVLILLAVFCFVMGNLIGQGEADNEGLGRAARSQMSSGISRKPAESPLGVHRTM